MDWLLYRVPENRVMHYGILLMLVTVFMPIFLLDRHLESLHYFNNFIIFDVIYYVVFEKFNFTNDE